MHDEPCFIIRQPSKWIKKLFFNILLFTILNSTINRTFCDTELPHELFRLKVRDIYKR